MDDEVDRALADAYNRDPSFQADEEWSRNTKGLLEKYVHPFKFQFHNKEFIFHQDNVTQPQDLGNTVWDGSLVLGAYLSNQKVFKEGYWKGKRLVELGAGVGVTGILAASLGASVVLTDLDNIVPLLEKNAQTNQKYAPLPIQVAVHSWGDDVKHLKPPVDAILAAECVYYENLVEPLCKTILDLSDEKTVTYAAFEAHNESGAQRFLETIPKYFQISKVPESDFDETYRTTRITVLQLKKK
jgi:predicted nicotinamide N-methyase